MTKLIGTIAGKLPPKYCKSSKDTLGWSNTFIESLESLNEENKELSKSGKSVAKFWFLFCRLS